MQYYKTDISKVLDKYKSDSIDREEAIRQACLAYDKEVAAPDADIVARREAFKERMTAYLDKYPQDIVNKFFEYWTSFKTPKSKLMLFEQQKSFNMGMRIATWYTNAQKFSRNTAMAKVVERRGYGK